MKKYIIGILLLFTLTSCVNTVLTIPTDINETAKKIIIDIDEELDLLDATGLKDDDLKVIEEPIYIGDNDEVSFKGDAMQRKSPLSIKVGKRKEIKFSGYQYILKTMELKNGDFIRIKDKNGDVFLDMKVIK